MTETKRSRCLGLLTLAVLMILPLGKAPEVTATTEGSIHASRVAEFIGDQEILMESEANTRILAAASMIDVALVNTITVCNDNVYANCLPRTEAKLD
ncbi:hypothetical protein SLA2020_063600 [Shorea laevis]